MQHIETCLLWQSFVSTCDVFNCLFPLDVQNEIQLPSRVFCYSWLVCLLYFWLRNAQLVKVGWHRFCFSPCWMRKRIIKAQAILALLDSSQELHREIWSAWVVIEFISNFMKSSAVYEASLCKFVLRVETLICHSMRYDISLQNFKKPLVDISPRIERKNFAKNI